MSVNKKSKHVNDALKFSLNFGKNVKNCINRILKYPNCVNNISVIADVPVSADFSSYLPNAASRIYMNSEEKSITSTARKVKILLWSEPAMHLWRSQ